MDGNTVAVSALGLTVLVQAAGVAFFLGATSQRVKDLSEILKGHIKLPTRRAHPDGDDK